MTPQELSFLFQIGSLNFPNQLVTPLALVFGYGMGLPVFVMAMRIFRKQGIRTRAKKVMFATAILCLVLNTIGTFSLVIEMASNYNAIHLFMEENSNLKATLGILEWHNFRTDTINNWTFSLSLIISDAIVLWRAWVLFTDRLWIMILPCAVLLGSLGCTLAEDIRLSIWTNYIVYPTGDPIDANLNTATGWLSLSTNTIATMLIGYRLWVYRSFWVNEAGMKSERLNSPVQKTLLLLVESGVLFCLSQIVTLVIQYLSQNQIINSYASAAASRVLVAAMFSFSAVYPTLIIVLVHSKKSVVETFNLSTIADGEALSPTRPPEKQKQRAREPLRFARTMDSGMRTTGENGE